MELHSVLCSTISLTIYQLSGLAAAAQLDRGTARLILVLIPENLLATDSLKIWNPSKMFSGAGQSEVKKRLLDSGKETTVQPADLNKQPFSHM